MIRLEMLNDGSTEISHRGAGFRSLLLGGDSDMNGGDGC